MKLIVCTSFNRAQHQQQTFQQLRPNANNSSNSNNQGYIGQHVHQVLQLINIYKMSAHQPNMEKVFPQKNKNKIKIKISITTSKRILWRRDDKI